MNTGKLRPARLAAALPLVGAPVHHWLTTALGGTHNVSPRAVGSAARTDDSRSNSMPAPCARSRAARLAGPCARGVRPSVIGGDDWRVGGAAGDSAALVRGVQPIACRFARGRSPMYRLQHRHGAVVSHTRAWITNWRPPTAQHVAQRRRHRVRLASTPEPPRLRGGLHPWSSVGEHRDASMAGSGMVGLLERVRGPAWKCTAAARYKGFADDRRHGHQVSAVEQVAGVTALAPPWDLARNTSAPEAAAGYEAGVTAASRGSRPRRAGRRWLRPSPRAHTASRTGGASAGRSRCRRRRRCGARRLRRSAVVVRCERRLEPRDGYVAGFGTGDELRELLVVRESGNVLSAISGSAPDTSITTPTWSVTNPWQRRPRGTASRRRGWTPRRRRSRRVRARARWL